MEENLEFGIIPMFTKLDTFQTEIEPALNKRDAFEIKLKFFKITTSIFWIKLESPIRFE